VDPSPCGILNLAGNLNRPIQYGGDSNHLGLLENCQSGRGTRNAEKNLSKDFKGGTRMALMRALKWAPTWYVSADISTFISCPDLIQRLAIKGISGVSPDLSSGGSFRSSHSGHSHGTLENDWEVFLHFEFPCRTVRHSPSHLLPFSSAHLAGAQLSLFKKCWAYSFLPVVLGSYLNSWQKRGPVHEVCSDVKCAEVVDNSKGSFWNPHEECDTTSRKRRCSKTL